MGTVENAVAKSNEHTFLLHLFFSSLFHQMIEQMNELQQQPISLSPKS